MSGRRINVERLLLEVLLQSANAAGRWHIAIAIGTVHESTAFLHHRLFSLAHQPKRAEYEAGGQRCGNATQCRKYAAGQLEQLPSCAALLLGLIEAAGTVVMTCKADTSE